MVPVVPVWAIAGRAGASIERRARTIEMRFASARRIGILPNGNQIIETIG
jgi:hypothetical protein